MKRDGVHFREGKFYISFVRNGKRHRHVTEASNIKEAKDLRAAEMLSLDKADLLGVQPPTEDSFEAKAKEHLAFQAKVLTPAILGRETQIFKSHLNPFLSGPIKDIRKLRVEQYWRQRDAAPATVRKELQILKHLFSFCVEHDYLPASPAQNVKGPKVLEAEEREHPFIPRERFKDFIDACPDWLRPIVGFATASGFRRRSVL